MQGVINSKFDKFVQYNKDDLQKARLIGTDDDGSATSMVKYYWYAKTSQWCYLATV